MKLGISSILIHGSLGCRHHLAIQISFYNGVQIHSASIVLTCRLKLKHVSMYTPYRMMHQQLKVSHAVLAAVCLRCLIDCSYWTSSKRLHLYSLNLKCLRQHVFKCLLSMKFLIPFPQHFEQFRPELQSTSFIHVLLYFLLPYLYDSTPQEGIDMMMMITKSYCQCSILYGTSLIGQLINGYLMPATKVQRIIGLN